MLSGVCRATICGLNGRFVANKLGKLNSVYREASARYLSLSSPLQLKQILVSTEGNRTVIEGKHFESPRVGKVIPIENPKDLCPLCPSKLGMDVKYTDVLIISQFVHADGTVLPQEVTKLCNRGHYQLIKLVEQARRAGLLRGYEPDKNDDDPEETNLKWRKYNVFFTS